jgi:hypothetical protein
MGLRRRAVFELAVLSTVACQGARPEPHGASSAAVASHATPALTSLLSPRASSRFACQGRVCRQSYPRLPTSGEWRCAESGRVVWCAGGEPAAGVVEGTTDMHFRCGKRVGQDPKGERVCLDTAPEYPGDSAISRCSFEQERGIVRVCKTESSEPQSPRPLPAHVVAACWLDRDCPSGRCDRGACVCTSDAGCESGRCAGGYCAEAKP